MRGRYLKLGGGLLFIIVVVSLLSMASFNDDYEDMLIQIVGLVLIFASSVLIAIESAKAKYLEVTKAKHDYEINQMDNALKNTFRICFSDEAIELKNTKQKIKEKINQLKKEKVLL